MKMIASLMMDIPHIAAFMMMLISEQIKCAAYVATHVKIQIAISI